MCAENPVLCATAVKFMCEAWLQKNMGAAHKIKWRFYHSVGTGCWLKCEETNAKQTVSGNLYGLGWDWNCNAERISPRTNSSGDFVQWNKRLIWLSVRFFFFMKAPWAWPKLTATDDYWYVLVLLLIIAIFCRRIGRLETGNNIFRNF